MSAKRDWHYVGVIYKFLSEYIYIYIYWFKFRADLLYVVQIVMTPSNGIIFLVTGLCVETSPVTGELPSERPVMQSFDAFFDLLLNTRLSKQTRRRRLETP